VLIRIAVPLSMSSAGTVEALKEGNAIEEELVQTMKRGLNIIADNMLQECRKRKAVLEDLEETLVQVGDVQYTTPVWERFCRVY
jgi:hypothetical protein